jgi:hypothetical protein
METTRVVGITLEMVLLIIQLMLHYALDHPLQGAKLGRGSFGVMVVPIFSRSSLVFVLSSGVHFVKIVECNFLHQRGIGKHIDSSPCTLQTCPLFLAWRHRFTLEQVSVNRLVDELYEGGYGFVEGRKPSDVVRLMGNNANSLMILLTIGVSYGQTACESHTDELLPGETNIEYS